MKYRPESLVALRDRPGIFIVKSFDAMKNFLVVVNSITGENVETSEGNIAVASDESLSKFRDETLAAAPVVEDSVVIELPYTEDEKSLALERQAVFDEWMSGKQGIEYVKKQLKIEATMIRRLRDRYIIIGDWTAFVPGKPGRKKGSTKFSPYVEEYIISTAEADYTGPGANEERVIDSIISALGKANAPSRATLRRRLRTILKERERIKAKEGEEAAQDKCGSYPFGLKVSGPLEVVEADGSPLDMHARCRQTGIVLGRPYLMLIKDKWSRSFLGFALYFGAPSRWTLAQALDMAIKPKEDLIRALGLDENVYKWIQYGRFSALMVDGGPDLNAKTVKVACEIHNVKHMRRKRKQSGGSIERGLGIINRYFIQTLEGAVPSSGKKRRGKKIEETAIYYLDEIFKMVVTEICRRHEKGGYDGMTSNDLWLSRFGEHNDEILTPPRFEDPLDFIIGMYHEHRVRVRKDAIIIHGILRYDPGPYYGHSGSHVRVKVDNSDIDRAWVLHNDRWVPIERLGPDLDDLRPFESVDPPCRFGPISMLAWKAKQYKQLKAGELTPAGERIHLSQQDIKKALQREALEQGRNAANATQSEMVGPFAKATPKKSKTQSKAEPIFDAADVEPLEGFDL